MKATRIITLFIFISTITFCQDNSVLLDSLFSTMSRRGQFYGNVLIAEHNEITFSKSYGFADREKKQQLNEQTLFNVGSVSKAFTAIAVLQLAEKQKLELSDKVFKYLPDFPYQEITIHHLLIHAGGLPDDFDLLKNSNWNNSKIATNKDVMLALNEQKPDLQFTPGESSEYSNLGYMILAEIVKQVSETDFKEHLQNNIFQPANMIRTGIYNAKQIKQVENVAKGYLFYPFTGKYEKAIDIPEFSTQYVTSGFQGDGNVYSSTIDLFNFYKALANNTLITEESLKNVFHKHIPAQMKGTPDFGNSYGYGWTIINAPIQVVQRGGELAGYVSNTVWNITEERLIIYLSNDYLSYTSYHNQIPYSIGSIFRQNTLQIPPMIASVELTKIVVTSSQEILTKKIEEIKNNPEIYQIDLQGLKFLVMKLEQIGNKKKADLIKNSFKPE
ncbi:MAG: serine hydrolase domain-containing protein [Bacteroidales bacterium]|jgi:CubicO group peptidase (beta-lactamase class C family)|nr:serine hydrolase domain-containing protein [Bacteroidales bacterium]